MHGDPRREQTAQDEDAAEREVEVAADHDERHGARGDPDARVRVEQVEQVVAREEDGRLEREEDEDRDEDDDDSVVADVLRADTPAAPGARLLKRRLVDGFLPGRGRGRRLRAHAALPARPKAASITSLSGGSAGNSRVIVPRRMTST